MEGLDKLLHETIWSDEITVTNGSTENLSSNPQIQQGGFGIKFWGCFSAFGLGPVVALKDNENQFTYKETFHVYLLPEIKAARTNFGLDMVSMQDNTPSHKTKLFRDFLTQHKILTGPTKSRYESYRKPMGHCEE
ncbi:hypothetical protein HDU92_002251 [Lobulomyces angularis]|nr:hypothetical protein HDU92_002251 [Lobulomyces angularis]